jgi:type VI secretion system secreted protein Hcp
MSQLLFIKIETIPGESTNADHRDELEVTSWSWITNQSPSSGSESTAGRPGTKIPAPFICFTHYIDKASPELLVKSFTGQRIPKALLSAQSAMGGHGNPVDFLKITMEDVIIKTIEPTGNAGPDRMTEKVTLSFSRLKEEYTSISSSGHSGTISRGFDFVKNKPL